MRIKSPFKDYYDQVSGYGYDGEGALFLRREEPLTRKEMNGRWLNKAPCFLDSLGIWELDYYGRDNLVARGALFFAGKEYHFARVNGKYRTVGPGATEWEKREQRLSKDVVVYSWDALLKETQAYRDRVDSKRGKPRWPSVLSSDKAFDRLEEFLGNQGSTKFSSQLSEHGISILAPDMCPLGFTGQDGFAPERETPHPLSYRLHTRDGVLNSYLGKFEFYRMLPAPQAYQELDMYLSGVLKRNDPDTVQIPDKYRIPQHGFDEYSFRKRPKEGG